MPYTIGQSTKGPFCQRPNSRSEWMYHATLDAWYLAALKPLTRYNAKKFCEANHAKLLSIGSRNEYLYVKKLMQTRLNGKDIWTGLKQNNKQKWLFDDKCQFDAFAKKSGLAIAQNQEIGSDEFFLIF